MREIIGQLLPTVGEPRVVTLSLPSRLTGPPPPVSWPKVLVLASIVVANVPHAPCVNDEPPLRARLPVASIVKAPLLVVVVPASWKVGAAMSTLAPGALLRFTSRKRLPPPPVTVFRWPLLVRVTAALFRLASALTFAS